MTNVDTERQLASATAGFDRLFGNQIVEAKTAFATDDSPFHQLGLGACAFLEAAMGQETGMMAEAARCLALAEAGSKKRGKVARESRGTHRFQPGLEWEILNADAVVLQGLVNALSESYMGYLSCIYALNNAHSKFTKLYKTVFPSGLNEYNTPATTPAPSPMASRKSSAPSLRSLSTAGTAAPSTLAVKSGLFGRWGGSSTSTLNIPKLIAQADPKVDGPIEDMIISGTAFGFGLFNLVFSLLPAKVKGVVSFFGFQSNRKVALQALAVSAAKQDVHSVFAGLVLMTYHGVVLLMSGYQADEAYILKQYRAILDNIETRYPTGALWILNRAKILRMSYDPDGAIRVLQDGLKADRQFVFREADTLLLFELAWTLLAQKRYEEAGECFIKITTLNSWSHATYYFIAAGCFFSLGNHAKTQELLDAIPVLLERKKISGKDLPTEVYIKKKLEFYKEKQKRRGGQEALYVEAIKISPAEEIAIFWNTHARIQKPTAEVHIQEWYSLTPPPSISSPFITRHPQTPSAVTAAEGTLVDLDTPDELAVRSLLLGIVHRTAGAFGPSRTFLVDAISLQPRVAHCTWVGGVASFELAVLNLREMEDSLKDMPEGEGQRRRGAWADALRDAGGLLDQALAMATSGNTDLSSRLDSRIAMLRDEISTKKEMLGIV